MPSCTPTSVGIPSTCLLYTLLPQYEKLTIFVLQLTFFDPRNQEYGYA